MTLLSSPTSWVLLLSVISTRLWHYSRSSSGIVTGQHQEVRHKITKITVIGKVSDMDVDQVKKGVTVLSEGILCK